MHEITVVKRRTRVWPILLTLLLLAFVVLAILWVMGYMDVGASGITFDALVTPSGSAPGSVVSGFRLR